MLQRSYDAVGGRTVSPDPRPSIEFLTVELMPLADGLLSVIVKATTCEPLREDDFELVGMQIANERVASLDQALAVIRDAFSTAH